MGLVNLGNQCHQRPDRLDWQNYLSARINAPSHNGFRPERISQSAIMGKGNVDFLTDTVDFYIELLNENDKPVDVFRETAKLTQNKIFLNRTVRHFDKQGNPTQS